MHYQTEAIVISKIKYSETSLIVSFISPEKGVIKAFIRGALSKKNINLYELGNLVNLNYSYKSDDRLATANAELITSYYPKIFQSKKKLLTLRTVVEMLHLLFPLEEENQDLFSLTRDFFERILEEDYDLYDYLKYELFLLEQIGIGLNLSKCIVSGSSDNLFYISPKSGNVVTRDVGKEFHDKLLLVPQYLIYEKPEDFNNKDLDYGRKMTEYFFIHGLLRQMQKNLPEVRNMLFREGLDQLRSGS